MALVDMAGLVGPDIGYDVGRRMRGPRRRFRGGRGLPSAPQRRADLEHFVEQLEPDINSAPAPRGPAYLPLGFPIITFTATSGTLLEATVQPQTLFQGRRVVVELVRTGATATGIVLMRNLTVGMKPINVSRNGVSVLAFAQNAFETDLLIPPAAIGNDITIQLQLVGTALVMTDNIIVAMSMIGKGVL